MKNSPIRVRFAPAPTGLMHLGNIRTALMNYLFAKQKNGIFVLRVEDTDPERNFDPEATIIIDDLYWLSLSFDEGPGVGGPYKPYFQSKRLDLYQQKLNELKDKGAIYRCFCTQEELGKKRQRQIALKLPPRYDRTCAHLTPEEIQNQLDNNIPFVWRVKLDHDAQITITDLARGEVTFKLQNFSDFPITRQNGSFTFMFANFVDDMLMNITHVFRGEDHLTNTAGQAYLYSLFNAPLPVFWHMPILCNIDGKKLSKRDFGFSLQDLKKEGYLPEAIINYLAIIGGSFKEEIMPQIELIKAIDFDNVHATGQIKYDVEKLNWVNRKWIADYDINELALACRPYLEAAYPLSKKLTDEQLAKLLFIIKTDMTTLKDSVPALHFYFEKPELTPVKIQACISPEHMKTLHDIVVNNLDIITTPDEFVTTLKKAGSQQNVPTKEVFWFLRLCLMGSTKGPGIVELISMLGTQEAKERIQHGLNVLASIA